uniref:G_PROTEIN_RECEP_F1_2 domain-containing protein n=1 Tax=Heterorhabditis bacteriophora TaxID=37862 RepID=A0A1I7WQQ7_HETBA
MEPTISLPSPQPPQPLFRTPGGLLNDKENMPKSGANRKRSHSAPNSHTFSQNTAHSTTTPQCQRVLRRKHACCKNFGVDVLPYTLHLHSDELHQCKKSSVQLRNYPRPTYRPRHNRTLSNRRRSRLMVPGNHEQKLLSRPGPEPNARLPLPTQRRLPLDHTSDILIRNQQPLTTCFRKKAEVLRQKQELRATISIVLIILLYLLLHSLQLYTVARKWQLLINHQCPNRSDYFQSYLAHILSMVSASVNAFVFIAFTNRLKKYVQMLIRKTSRTLSNSSEPPLSPKTTITIEGSHTHSHPHNSKAMKLLLKFYLIYANLDLPSYVAEQTSLIRAANERWTVITQ